MLDMIDEYFKTHFGFSIHDAAVSVADKRRLDVVFRESNVTWLQLRMIEGHFSDVEDVETTARHRCDLHDQWSLAVIIGVIYHVTLVSRWRGRAVLPSHLEDSYTDGGA